MNLSPSARALWRFRRHLDRRLPITGPKGREGWTWPLKAWSGERAVNVVTGSGYVYLNDGDDRWSVMSGALDVDEQLAEMRCFFEVDLCPSCRDGLS